MSKSRTASRRSAAAKMPAAPKPRVPLTQAVVEAQRGARRGRQEQARESARRRSQRRRLLRGAIAAAVVLVVGGLLAAVLWRDANLPGESVAQQASSHIAGVDSPHAPYSTDPPTSGPHVSQVPPWGVSPTAIAKELQVHALEDGGVVISYQPALDAAMVARLDTLVSGYGAKVILAPYPGLATPIVATAWNRMARFNQYDEAGLRRFIDAFKGIDHHQQSGS